jgi:hypothetical protein
MAVHHASSDGDHVDGTPGPRADGRVPGQERFLRWIKTSAKAREVIATRIPR